MSERADKCDCDTAGTLPPGWCCGKPECHRTILATARLKAMVKEVFKARSEGTFSLPQSRASCIRSE